MIDRRAFAAFLLFTLAGCADPVAATAPDAGEPETVVEAGPCWTHVRSRPAVAGGMVSAYEECPPGESLLDAGCELTAEGPYDTQETTRFDGGILCNAVGNVDGAAVVATVSCCPPGAGR